MSESVRCGKLRARGVNGFSGASQIKFISVRLDVWQLAGGERILWGVPNNNSFLFDLSKQFPKSVQYAFYQFPAHERIILGLSSVRWQRSRPSQPNSIAAWFACIITSWTDLRLHPWRHIQILSTLFIAIHVGEFWQNVPGVLAVTWKKLIRKDVFVSCFLFLVFWTKTAGSCETDVIKRWNQLVRKKNSRNNRWFLLRW